MKQGIQYNKKLVNVDVHQMQVFVITNNVGIKINIDVNVKNQLKKEDVIQDLFEILETMNVKVINHVMLENIQIMKIVNAEKKLVDKIFEECSKDINRNEMIYNGTLNDYENKCNSCTINLVLFVILLTISIALSSAFIYFDCY